jgi:hypothetical protein
MIKSLKDAVTYYWHSLHIGILTYRLEHYKVTSPQHFIALASKRMELLEKTSNLIKQDYL